MVPLKKSQILQIGFRRFGASLDPQGNSVLPVRARGAPPVKQGPPGPPVPPRAVRPPILRPLPPLPPLQLVTSKQRPVPPPLPPFPPVALPPMARGFWPSPPLPPLVPFAPLAPTAFWPMPITVSGVWTRSPPTILSMTASDISLPCRETAFRVVPPAQTDETQTPPTASPASITSHKAPLLTFVTLLAMSL